MTQNEFLEKTPMQRSDQEKVDFRDFVDEVGRADFDKVTAMNGLEGEKLDRDIQEHIDQLEREFEEDRLGIKDGQTFDLLIGRLDLLKNNIDDRYRIDRCWRQDQVDFLLSAANKYMDDPHYSNRISQILTTEYKNEPTQESISDLSAKALLNLINKEHILSESMERVVRAMAQNSQMIDLGIRIDLMAACLDNPSQVSRYTTGELIGYAGGYGSGFPRELVEYGIDQEENTAKQFRVVDILSRLSRMRSLEGYEAASGAAAQGLKDIYRRSDSYFLRSKIKQLDDTQIPFLYSGERMSPFTQEAIGYYDQPDLRQGAPHMREAHWYREQDQLAERCAYSKVSPKYGAIYNPFDANIDSFFPVDDRQQSLTLRDIVERENINFLQNIPAEQADMVLGNYMAMTNAEFRRQIEKDFNIEISDYTIREQLQFVNFLSSKMIKEVETVRKFLQQGHGSEAKANRVRSFLSLETDRAMGKTILKIGDKLPPESADAVFAKYAEIMDQATSSWQYINDIIPAGQEADPDLKGKVETNLSKKAGQLLTDFAKRADFASGDKSKLALETVLNELEQYKTDLVFSASVFRSLQESGKEVGLEDLEGLEFKVMTIQELTENGQLMKEVRKLFDYRRTEEFPSLPAASLKGAVKELAQAMDGVETNKASQIMQMLDIYWRNYHYKPALQKEIVPAFAQRLENGTDETNIYLLVKNGKVMAFMRFDQLSGQKKYAGSLNVYKGARGLAVGSAFVHEAYAQEAPGFTIEADCDPTVDVSSHYIETDGYIATAIDPDYHGTGESIMSIEIGPQNDQYKYRRKENDGQGKTGLALSRDTIMAEYEKNSLTSKPESGDVQVRRFERNSAKFYQEADRLLNKEGMVLTRFFHELKENGEPESGEYTYCVFERSLS